MVFHMKTTIIIPDSLFRELKKRAVERNETVSALVIDSLRKNLADKGKPRKLAPLPTFKCGRAMVDIADRDALYRVMEKG